MPVHKFCFSIGVDLQAFVPHSTSFVILRHCKYLLPFASVSTFESSVLFGVYVCKYYLYYYSFVECFTIWIYKSPISLLYFFLLFPYLFVNLSSFVNLLRSWKIIQLEFWLTVHWNYILRIANFIILNCSSKNMIFIDIIFFVFY